MTYKVYILATRKDFDKARDLAGRLENALEKAKANIFPVEKTVSEERIETSVSRELKEADEVFVILTESSVNDSGVISGIGAAASLSKRLTPVVIDVDIEALPTIIKKGYITYSDLSMYISYLQEELEKRTKSPLFIKARIGKLEAELRKPVPYTQRPLRTSSKSGAKETPDLVQVADQVLLKIDAMEHPDFVRAASDPDAPITLLDESGETVRGTIQGVKSSFPVAEIRVQPESR